MRQILNAQRKARRNLKRRTRRFAAVTAGQARHLEKADLTASRTLAEMGTLAFFNLATLFDAQGTLKPLSDLPAEARSALASVEVVRRKLTAGDGAPTWVHKVKIGDKLKALEMLAKHFRLRGEPVAVNGVDWEKLAARLARARTEK